MIKQLSYTFVFLFALSGFIPLGAQNIRIDTPVGGFTTKRIQTIRGSITGYNSNRATLIVNGIPQVLPLTGGQFQLDTVAAPGNNLIEVQAGNKKESVSFYARVPKRDIKVVLIWDTPTDVDLWVIDPTGEKTYYANKESKSGGNLDVDITTGYGPETFTMAKALPGSYALQVQYYSSSDAPVTRVNIYVILYEGTPMERREHFQFVMTRAHQVYHIADFQIEGS